MSRARPSRLGSSCRATAWMRPVSSRRKRSCDGPAKLACRNGDEPGIRCAGRGSRRRFQAGLSASGLRNPHARQRIAADRAHRRAHHEIPRRDGAAVRRRRRHRRLERRRAVRRAAARAGRDLQDARRIRRLRLRLRDDGDSGAGRLRGRCWACFGSALPYAFAPLLTQAGVGTFQAALSLRAIIGGVAVGLGAALVFSIMPAGSVHDVPGALLLRDDAARAAGRCGCAIALSRSRACCCSSSSRSASPATGASPPRSSPARLSSPLFFDGAARLLARGVRAACRRRCNPIAALAWSGLSRTSRMSRAVIVSLGIGLVVLAATSAVTASLRAQLTRDCRRRRRIFSSSACRRRTMRPSAPSCTGIAGRARSTKRR